MARRGHITFANGIPTRRIKENRGGYMLQGAIGSLFLGMILLTNPL